MNDVSVKISTTRGETLLDSLLKHGASLPHECEGALVCGSCRVIVRKGIKSLDPACEDELDVLDGASSSEPPTRLACRATSVGGDLVIEIPLSDSLRIATLSRRPAPPIVLSERAAEHLAKRLATRASSKAVRLAVRAAGCSGLRYAVDYADVIGSQDAVFEFNGLRIVVDPESLLHVEGTFVDLEREGLSHRLSFDNPNALLTCGCGESFGTSRASMKSASSS